MSRAILEGLCVDDLVVRYGRMTAVRGVTLSTRPGETLAIVGESGSGKSTIAQAIVGLVSAANGHVTIDGTPVLRRTRKDRRAFARRVQMVFQDSASALNPGATVSELIEEPLIVHGLGSRTERKTRVAELLDAVKLSPSVLGRYPREFSGGQKQRIAMARALAVEPDYLILDEVTSALDVSIQAAILDLLAELQRSFDLGYIFISHDLAVVSKVSDTIAVMRDGTVVEHGLTRDILDRPVHEYTQTLIAAVPVIPR